MFGIDKDIQAKLQAKLDPEKQAQAQAWVEAVTGEEFPSGFQESLKSGTRLCQLVNAIQAGSVKRVKDSKMPFVQRENIVNYLNACKKLGMMETDCFVTQDLFEGDNIIAVTDQIFSLGALSRKIEGFNGPYLGVKFADENKRQFTEEQLANSRAIVPQQNAGSIEIEKNKGTDHIVLYGKAGAELGQCSAEASQQTAGSIAVEKSKGTDSIVQYGKVGQELGKASNEPTQQNSGSIDTGRQGNLDSISRAMN